MRRKFRVRVGEQTFDVEVEELTEAKGPLAVGAPVSRPIAATHPAVAAEAKPSAGLEEKSGMIRAPLPGKVLAIRVREGASVKSGDTVLVLESMKMENEIVAPRSGVVKKVHVVEQASVNYGDMLMEIE